MKQRNHEREMKMIEEKMKVNGPMDTRSIHETIRNWPTKTGRRRRNVPSMLELGNYLAKGKQFRELDERVFVRTITGSQYTVAVWDVVGEEE